MNTKNAKTEDVPGSLRGMTTEESLRYLRRHRPQLARVLEMNMEVAAERDALRAEVETLRNHKKTFAMLITFIVDALIWGRKEALAKVPRILAVLEAR